MTGNFKRTIGTRAEVWHGTAKKTSGGLTKDDLLKNKSGRIVSKAKHNTAKKEMRLKKHGYGPKSRKELKRLSKKGHSRKASRKMRGGSSALSPADITDSYMLKGGASLSPADVNDSYMIKDVMPQKFSPLDRALSGGRRRKRSMKGGVGKMVGAANYSEPAPLAAALSH